MGDLGVPGYHHRLRLRPSPRDWRHGPGPKRQGPHVRRAIRPGPAPPGAFARELSATFALGWPLILANVAVTAITATDFTMLGRQSPHALAAASLGFNLFMPTLLFGIGIVAALSPIAAARIGAGAIRRACARDASGVAVGAVGRRFRLVALSQTTRILVAIGEPPDLARDAGLYMWGSNGASRRPVFFAGRSLFAALERTRPALIAGLLAVATNALGNWALIFGHLGLPALGLFGSGLATTLRKRLCRDAVRLRAIDPRLRALRLFALPWRFALRISPRCGGSACRSRSIVAEVGVFSAAGLAMGLIGRAAVEAHAAALQIASIAFMVPLGLGQAATVRVGLAYGARDRGPSRAPARPPSPSRCRRTVSAATMTFAPRILVAPFLSLGAPERRSAVRSPSPCCRWRPSSRFSTRARSRSSACCAACRIPAGRSSSRCPDIGASRRRRPRARLPHAARRRRRLDRAGERPPAVARAARRALARHARRGFVRGASARARRRRQRRIAGSSSITS